MAARKMSTTTTTTTTTPQSKDDLFLDCLAHKPDLQTEFAKELKKVWTPLHTLRSTPTNEAAFDKVTAGVFATLHKVWKAVGIPPELSERVKQEVLQQVLVRPMAIACFRWAGYQDRLNKQKSQKDLQDAYKKIKEDLTPNATIRLRNTVECKAGMVHVFYNNKTESLPLNMNGCLEFTFKNCLADLTKKSPSTSWNAPGKGSKTDLKLHTVDFKAGKLVITIPDSSNAKPAIAKLRIALQRQDKSQPLIVAEFDWNSNSDSLVVPDINLGDTASIAVTAMSEFGNGKKLDVWTPSIFAEPKSQTPSSSESQTPKSQAPNSQTPKSQASKSQAPKSQTPKSQASKSPAATSPAAKSNAKGKEIVSSSMTTEVLTKKSKTTTTTTTTSESVVKKSTGNTGGGSQAANPANDNVVKEKVTQPRKENWLVNNNCKKATLEKLDNTGLGKLLRFHDIDVPKSKEHRIAAFLIAKQSNKLKPHTKR